MRKTIFLDIDGTLIRHHNRGLSAILTETPELLQGTIEKLNEWEAKGYTTILCTGRAESMREFTKRQLDELGVFYSQLLMGISGDRVLVNDQKPDGRSAAFAINIPRNVGIEEIDI